MSGTGAGLINPDDIPDDLAPGTYCCRLDESSTMRELRLRFVTPPRAHVLGDCLLQVIKHETGDVGTGQDKPVTIHDAMRDMNA